jgi:hypothetical protein
MIPHFCAYMALLPEQRKAIVLLANVDHPATKFAFDEIGAGAGALVAGSQALSHPRVARRRSCLRGLRESLAFRPGQPHSSHAIKSS